MINVHYAVWVSYVNRDINCMSLCMSMKETSCRFLPLPPLSLSLSVCVLCVRASCVAKYFSLVL